MEKDGFTLTRRALLIGGMAAGAGLAAGCLRKTAEGLSAKDVLCAEKLAGVDYSEAEREQLAATLEEQLERLRAIRTLEQPNELAPALTFDPRLKGRDYPLDAPDFRFFPAGAPALPASEEEIAFAPAAHLAQWIRTRRISSRELTGLYLKRIRKFAPGLECFVTVTEDLALAQAAKADRALAAGDDRGPLHGLPYGLKDLIDTANVKTTWGAAPYRERVAEEDAWIVKRLRDAGAVLLGKTTCGAIAYGDIWFGGKTRNPWNPAEGSSGSSAGSASATAAGLCAFSIGSETLGSIVSPSNRCGTAGLRPTFGRVPRTGAMALCWSLDKLGPICRTAADTLLVLSVINGEDSGDPASFAAPLAYAPEQPPETLTVGFDPAWFEGENVHPLDLEAFEAVKATGVALREIRIPERPYSGLITVLEAEAAAAFEELTQQNKDDLLVWQDPEAWPNTWRRARFIPAIDVINADRLRRTVMEDFAGIFDQVDVLAGPNFAGPMLVATNYTGHPQLTFRAGFFESPPRGLFGTTIEGPAKPVPRNFSLWGPLFGEGTLARLGTAVEERLGAVDRRPALG